MGYRNMWDKRDLDSFTQTLERVENALDRMELQTFVVAADLSDSKSRADRVVAGSPGEAADVAAKNGADKISSKIS